MPGIFERANEEVILSGGRKIEYGTPRSVTAADAVPTTGDQGVALLNSPTVILDVKPANGETIDVRVYLYLNSSRGWRLARNGVLSGIEGADGLTARINTSGYERIFVRVLSTPVQPTEITIGRAVL